jgi:predicted nucleic acid-binding protein
MLDTSAINRVHDSQQCEWSLRGPLYVTDIQLQEIAQTRDPHRRASLLGAFYSLRLTVVRPAGRLFNPDFFGFPSFFADDLSFDGEDYPLSLGRVMPVIAASMGSRVERYFPDALIAEAALTSNLTLVTADRRLAKVGRSFGIQVEEIP